MKRLPVIIVSGFAGAGKTSLIERLLSSGRERWAVLLDGSGAPSGSLASAQQSLRRAGAIHVATLSGSCICGTRHSGMVREVLELSGSGAVDGVVIETSPVGAPLRLATHFAFRDDAGHSLQEVTELRAVLTVVDGQTFLSRYTAEQTIHAAGLSADPADRRYVARVLAEQVEFADIVVVTRNKCTPPGVLELLSAILQHMNPCARIHHGTGSLDMCELGRARRTTAFLGEYAGYALDVAPSVSAVGNHLGVTSFIYRARRPFHPARLREHLMAPWPGVLRSRGIFWVATRMSEVGSWSLAGPVWQVGRAGFWWAALPEAAWPSSRDQRMAISSQWQEPHGDRRQEILVIGMDISRSEIEVGFDRCLLSDSELALGPNGWHQLADPFADWNPAHWDTDSIAAVN